MPRALRAPLGGGGGVLARVEHGAPVLHAFDDVLGPRPHLPEGAALRSRADHRAHAGERRIAVRAGAVAAGARARR
ncbi:MAG: hypothetical protein ACK559_20375, partial [bacterium]